jgi:hypothetical protein
MAIALTGLHRNSGLGSRPCEDPALNEQTIQNKISRRFLKYATRIKTDLVLSG